MLDTEKNERIAPEILAEQWFGFLQTMISRMQSAYREAQVQSPGFNKKTLAARIGKKPSFVSRCISGQQNMTARTIHDIFRGMGYRPEVVLIPLHAVPPANRLPIPSPATGSSPPLGQRVNSATSGNTIIEAR